MKIIKSIIKNLLPYGVVRKLESRHSMFSSPLPCWQEAEKQSDGYAAENIFKATLASTRKVLEGVAAYTRDSVCFDHIEYSYLLLLGLYMAALKNGNSLNVLDFGGSLGTSYLQNRGMLAKLSVKWNIVEQEHFVKAGKDLYAESDCRFYYSIEECLQKNAPNVILLSSVLPYIKDKDSLVNELLEVGADYIIIDRTVVSDSAQDLVVIQEVPEEIYKASYPAWVISRSGLLEQVCQKYDLLFEENSFTDSVANDMLYSEKCFVFQKR